MIYMGKLSSGEGEGSEEAFIRMRDLYRISEPGTFQDAPGSGVDQSFAGLIFSKVYEADA